MTMSVLKAETAEVAPAKLTADVVRFTAPKPSFVQARLMPMLGNVAANVIPPLVMLTLLLVVWELLCNRPGATLPPPTKIWTEAYDLIIEEVAPAFR